MDLSRCNGLRTLEALEGFVRHPAVIVIFHQFFSEIFGIFFKFTTIQNVFFHV